MATNPYLNLADAPAPAAKNPYLDLGGDAELAPRPTPEPMRAAGPPANPFQPRPLGQSVTPDVMRPDQPGGPKSDYDMEGYTAKYGKPDQSKGQHLTDEFKRPNHMTFSAESKYSTPETKGGEWKQEGGKWHFHASPWNLQQHSAQEMKDYFKKVEPDSVLHLPGEESASGAKAKSAVSPWGEIPKMTTIGTPKGKADLSDPLNQFTGSALEAGRESAVGGLVGLPAGAGYIATKAAGDITDALFTGTATRNPAFGQLGPVGEQTIVPLRQGLKHAQDYFQGILDYQDDKNKLAHLELESHGVDPKSVAAQAGDLTGATVGMIAKFANPIGLQIALLESGIGGMAGAQRQGFSFEEAAAKGLLSSATIAAMSALPGGEAAGKSVVALIAKRAGMAAVEGAGFTALDAIVNRLVMGKDTTVEEFGKEFLKATAMMIALKARSTAKEVGEVKDAREVTKAWSNWRSAENGLKAFIQENHMELFHPDSTPAERSQALRNVQQGWQDLHALEYAKKAGMKFTGKPGEGIDAAQEVRDALAGGEFPSAAKPSKLAQRKAASEAKRQVKEALDKKVPVAPPAEEAAPPLPIDQIRDKVPEPMRERFDTDMAPYAEREAKNQADLAAIQKQIQQQVSKARNEAKAQRGKDATDADVQRILAKRMEPLNARLTFLTVDHDMIQQSKEATANRWRKLVDPNFKEAPDASQEQGPAALGEQPGGAQGAGREGSPGVGQRVPGQETAGTPAPAQEEKAQVGPSPFEEGLDLSGVKTEPPAKPQEPHPADDRRQSDEPVDVDRRGAERRAKIRGEAAKEIKPEDMTPEQAKEEVANLRRQRELDQRIPDMPNELAFDRAYNEGDDVASLDVRGLKKANEHGQEVGTAFLVHIGKKLHVAAQTAKQLAAHITGDEFALTGAPEAKMRALVDQVNAALDADPFRFKGPDGKTIELRGELHYGAGKSPEAAGRVMAEAKKTRAAKERAEKGLDPTPDGQIPDNLKSALKGAPSLKPDGDAFTIAAEDLHVDPKQLQWRKDADPVTGNTGRGKGWKFWSEKAAKTIDVWLDPKDGKTKVANGHNRKFRGDQLGVTKYRISYLDADTAKEAMIQGALLNLHEGNVDPMEVAFYLRERKVTADDLERRGIDINNPNVKNGIAIKSLPDDWWEFVSNNKDTIPLAAEAGKAGLTEPQAHIALKELGLLLAKDDDPGNVSSTDWKGILDRVKRVKVEAKQEGGALFDTEEYDSNLADQAKAIRAVEDRLRAKRTTGKVMTKGKFEEGRQEAGVKANEKAASMEKDADTLLQHFRKVRDLTPEIGEKINEIADQHKRAGSAQEKENILAQGARAIEELVQRDLEGGRGPAEPGRAAGAGGEEPNAGGLGLDEPAAPEAQPVPEVKPPEKPKLGKKGLGKGKSEKAAPAKEEASAKPEPPKEKAKAPEKAEPAKPETGTKVLATFPNPEDGIEARVVQTPKGFSVTIKDTDAGEVVPSATIYKTEAEAMAAAKSIAEGKPKPEVAKPPVKSPIPRPAPATMTAGEINRDLDALDKRSAQHTEAMIAAGRGDERPSDWMKKDDTLSKAGRALADRRAALRNEIESRYGPNAPSRLPAGRGFGPREKAEKPGRRADQVTENRRKDLVRAAVDKAFPDATEAEKREIRHLSYLSGLLDLESGDPTPQQIQNVLEANYGQALAKVKLGKANPPAPDPDEPQGAPTKEERAAPDEPQGRPTKNTGEGLDILAPKNGEINPEAGAVRVIHRGTNVPELLTKLGQRFRGLFASSPGKAKGISNDGVRILYKQLEDAGMLQHPYNPRTHEFNFAKSLITGEVPKVRKGKDGKNMDISNPLKSQNYVLSPHQFIGRILPNGETPNVDLELAANRYTLIHKGAADLVKDIHERNQIPDHSERVGRVMDPHRNKINELVTWLEPLVQERSSLTRKIADAKNETEERIYTEHLAEFNDEHSDEIAKGRQDLDEYYVAAKDDIRGLAETTPEVRVALWMEPIKIGKGKDAKKVHQAWLKDIIKPNEIKAAEELLAFTAKARDAGKRLGIPMRSDEYITHLIKPEHLGQYGVDKTGDQMRVARDILAFHRRQENSVNLMPSTHAAMAYYVPTIARKIATQPFLNKWYAGGKNPYLDPNPASPYHAPQFGEWLQKQISDMQNPTPDSIIDKGLSMLKTAEITKAMALNQRVTMKHLVGKVTTVAALHGRYMLPAMKDSMVEMAHRPENWKLVQTAYKKITGKDLERTGKSNAEIIQLLTSNVVASRALRNAINEAPLIAEYNEPIFNSFFQGGRVRQAARAVSRGYAKTRNFLGQPLLAVEGMENGLNALASARRGVAADLSPEQNVKAMVTNLLDYSFRGGHDSSAFLRSKVGRLTAFSQTPSKMLENYASMIHKAYRGEKDIYGGSETATLIRQIVALGTVTYLGEKYGKKGGLHLQHMLFHTPFTSPEYASDFASFLGNKAMATMGPGEENRAKSEKAAQDARARMVGSKFGPFSVTPSFAIGKDVMDFTRDPEAFLLSTSAVQGIRSELPKDFGNKAMKAMGIQDKKTLAARALNFLNGKVPEGYEDAVHYLASAPTEEQNKFYEFLRWKTGFKMTKSADRKADRMKGP